MLGAHIGRLLDTRFVLDEAHLFRLHDLAHVDRSPIPTRKLGLAPFGRRVVQQILQGLLRQGRMARAR